MAGEYDDDEDQYSSDPSGGGYSPYGGQPPLAIMQQEQFTTPEALEYAKKILKRTVDENDPEAGQDYLSKIQANADTARAALQRAREKLAAQEYGNSEKWLAIAAGAGAPTKTGAIGESASNIADRLREPLQNKRKFNTERDKGLLDIDLGLAGVDNGVLSAQLQLMKMKQDQDTRLSAEALKILGRRLSAGQQIPQKAIEAVDRAYAKDYVDFVQNGASDAAKALEELGMARDELRGYYVDKDGKKKKVKGGKSDMLTGPIVGTLSNLPWVGKTLQDVAFPKSANVQETVEYTIQRSLRPILGSQFTKEEGERLIARVYNPRLDEKTNADRLDRLLKQLHRAYNSKIAASQYFEKNHTLNGFRGKTQWSTDDFLPDNEKGKGTQSSQGKQSPLDTQHGYLPPVEDMPELDYESIIPAGEDYAEGGEVHGYAEGGDADHEGREPHQMPDGRVIWAPVGTPDENVLKRYEAALGHAFEPPQEDAPGATVPDQEPEATEPGGFDFDAPTAVGLAGSAIGHGLLGAAGGRYGAKTAHRLADFLPNHKVSNAESRVLQGLEHEGLSPDEWTKLVLKAQRMGVPLTGIDTGGIELRGLAEASLNPENPETRQLYTEMTNRQAGARERVGERVNQSLKPDDYQTMRKRLKTDLNKNSSPMYTELSKKYPSLKSETLMQIMDTPSGKKAVERAVKSIRDRPGATLGKQDAMGMVTKPSIEFLDQVKDELDDMINKEEMTGDVYNPTKKGRRIRALRNALRDEVDKLTTDPKSGESAYKAARKTWAGDLEIMDALRLGREEFSKLPPDEFKEAIKDLDFSERDALRTGVAQTLMDRLGKTGKRVNPADKLVDSPATLEKLEAVFDNPNEFKLFKEALEAESKMFDESKSTIGKARRVLMSTRDPDTGILARTKKVAKDAPTLGIFRPVQWILRYFRRQPAVGKKEAAEIIRILRTRDPAELRQLEARLTPKVGRVLKRKKRVGKAALAGAAVGAAMPFLNGNDEEIQGGEPVTDEEEESGYARGGLVRRILNHSMFGGDDIVTDLETKLE